MRSQADFGVPAVWFTAVATAQVRNASALLSLGWTQREPFQQRLAVIESPLLAETCGVRLGPGKTGRRHVPQSAEAIWSAT